MRMLLAPLKFLAGIALVLVLLPVFCIGIVIAAWNHKS